MLARTVAARRSRGVELLLLGAMAASDPRETVLAYQEGMKHTPESVRCGWRLDWSAFPAPCKEYSRLPPEPLEGELAPLLRLGAGAVRARGPYVFRTYSSAGALYPNELYVSRPGEGLFHFHPGASSACGGCGRRAFWARRWR